jgi:hypothetical protein
VGIYGVFSAAEASALKGRCDAIMQMLEAQWGYHRDQEHEEVMILATWLVVTHGLFWNAVRPGVWQSEMKMATTGPLAKVRVVAIRLDPSRLDFSLDTATSDYGMRGAWTIDALPPACVLAFIAGQFTGGYPWGWLVRDGVVSRKPGLGTLAMAFVLDSRTVSSRLTSYRPCAGMCAWLSIVPVAAGCDGREPWEPAARAGINLNHRDSRLALGILDDGSLVVALTRFAGLVGRPRRCPGDPRYRRWRHSCGR